MAERGEETRRALLAAVARVRPEIEAASGEGESLMTLPASSVDLLAESGLLRIKLPEVLGGFEADLITQYEVIEAILRGRRRRVVLDDRRDVHRPPRGVPP
jgi:hypothetical protein